MQRLNKNVLCEIFSFLTHTELCIVSSTCSYLNAVCQSDILWNTTPNPGTGPARKREFCLRGLRTSRIFNKICQKLLLHGHSQQINTVKISGNKVLTASDDGTVRLFSTRKSKGKLIIRHQNSVTAALFWDKGVVSASADRYLKVWQKNKDLVEVRAHKSGITKIRNLDGKRVVTGGYDGAVKIWDLNKRAKDPVLENQEFNGDVSLVETYQNFYASCSSNENFISFRDANHPEAQTKFEINNPVRPGRILPNFVGIRSMLIRTPLLYSGETDCIKIWDLRLPGPVVRIFDQQLNFNYENRSGIFRLYLNEPHQLLVGSKGLNGLVEFDLRTLGSRYFPVHDYQILNMRQGEGILKNLVVTSGTTKSFSYEISIHLVEDLNRSIKYTPGHKGVINSLDVGDSFISTGGKDGSVVVLDFNKTKERLRTEQKSIKIYS